MIDVGMFLIILPILLTIAAGYLQKKKNRSLRSDIGNIVLAAVLATIVNHLFGVLMGGGILMNFLIALLGATVGLFILRKSRTNPAQGLPKNESTLDTFSNSRTVGRGIAVALKGDSNGTDRSDRDDIYILNERKAVESSVIIGIEEVPLDNRFGSNVIVSEHEFSRKATRSLTIERSKGGDFGIKSNLLAVLGTEVKASLAQHIGIDLQSEEFRRVTIRFEAAPGKLVLYRVIWKQIQRSGEAELVIRGEQMRVPYTALYGLSHSVESVSQQVDQ